jgi:hypothetical protein
MLQQEFASSLEDVGREVISPLTVYECSEAGSMFSGWHAAAASGQNEFGYRAVLLCQVKLSRNAAKREPCICSSSTVSYPRLEVFNA